jgi:methionyl-tRNA formyltransferase
MVNDVSIMSAPRVVFMGMLGNFSAPSLTALLESGVDVCAVIVPAASPRPGGNPLPIRRVEPPTRRLALPLLHTSSSVLHIAWERHIPVWEVYNLKHAQTCSILLGYEPDILCVACFSLLIPPVILSLPRLGCLNVHPALLPANRGPVPLFWTFREGHKDTGVTIHFMEKKMDSGAILAQERFAVLDGIRYQQLEAECAQLGGILLARTTWNLFKGIVQSISQDETKSSYHTFPTQADLIVDPHEWGARHLYNFIRGIGFWEGPVELHLAGEHMLASDAISYALDGSKQASELSTMDNERTVPCRDGHVRIVLALPMYS